MASFGTPISARPLSSVIKKSILNFVQGLIPNTLYRLFQILLTDCCPLNIISTSVVCDPSNPGGYILTFTFDRTLSFAGQGIMQIDSSSLAIHGDLKIFPDGQSFVSIPLASGSTSGDGVFKIVIPSKPNFLGNLLALVESGQFTQASLFNLLSPNVTLATYFLTVTLPSC